MEPLPLDAQGVGALLIFAEDAVPAGLRCRRPGLHRQLLAEMPEGDASNTQTKQHSCSIHVISAVVGMHSPLNNSDVEAIPFGIHR